MSPPSSRLLVIPAPERHLDAVLLEAVSPLARSLPADPGFQSLYFHRHVKPDWNLKVSIRSRGPGSGAAVEERAGALLRPLLEQGRIRAWEWAGSERVAEEIAGPAAAPDVERLLHHDSAACLDLLECEAAGATSKSRREFSLVMTERTLDLLLGGDPRGRLAFYRLGFELPFGQGTWTEADRRVLEERYLSLRHSLAAWLGAGTGAEAVWGGSAAAGIAERCLSASRPHLESLRRARLDVGVVPLARELCRRHCNRLGIDGLAEAVLRYLMFRLHQEGGTGAA